MLVCGCGGVKKGDHDDDDDEHRPRRVVALDPA